MSSWFTRILNWIGPPESPEIWIIEKFKGFFFYLPWHASTTFPCIELVAHSWLCTNPSDSWDNWMLLYDSWHADNGTSLIFAFNSHFDLSWVDVSIRPQPLIKIIFKCDECEYIITSCSYVISNVFNVASIGKLEL